MITESISRSGILIISIKFIYFVQIFLQNYHKEKEIDKVPRYEYLSTSIRREKNEEIKQCREYDYRERERKKRDKDK